MSEGFSLLKILLLCILALAVVFGLFSKKKIIKSILLIIVAPVFLIVAYNYIKEILDSLNHYEQTIAILIIIFVCLIILLLMTKTGREIFASVVGSFIYDIFKSLFRKIKYLFVGITQRLK